jgi:hypothetical protein
VQKLPGEVVAAGCEVLVVSVEAMTECERSVHEASREMPIYLAGLHQPMLAVEEERRLTQGLRPTKRRLRDAA